MKTSLSAIRRTLILIWPASRGWMVAWVCLLLALGVLPAASVFLMKRLVDALAQSVGAGAGAMQVSTLLIPAGLMLAVVIAQRLLGALNEWVDTVQTRLVQDHIKDLIHDKAAAIDYSFFESPAYHDQLSQANTQASMRALNLLKTLGGIAQSVVTFASISMILVRYSAWLPAMLLVTSVPAFYVLLKQNRRYHAWWKETTADRRRAFYLDLLITSQLAAAEIRLNDLGPFFKGKYRELIDRMRAEELTLTRQRIFARITAGLIAMLVTGVAMIWIVGRAMNGRATLGDLALFYQAFNQGQSLAGALLSGMGDIHTNVLFLEQVFEYLDTSDIIVDSPRPSAFPIALARGVRFDNVSFTYEGGKRPAVDHLTLDVPAGQIVAIVGANGSGKSTLIKLLCRFYDPVEGRITVDGIDLRDLPQQDLRRQISVMMQFPVKYHLTVAENIQLGDLRGAHGEDQVERAARGAGAHDFISRLAARYDTPLGRTFKDSAELSGGEWQRLALARAFLRRAQIVVLDEPTSFMDSWNEHEWLQRFRTMVEGRTVLIITHRFTTAMQADIIHVMDGGRIVESGTHAELLALDGRYASSWTEQVKAGANAVGTSPREAVTHSGV